MHKLKSLKSLSQHWKKLPNKNKIYEAHAKSKKTSLSMDVERIGDIDVSFSIYFPLNYVIPSTGLDKTFFFLIDKDIWILFVCDAQI